MLCTLHVLATQSVVRRPASSASVCDFGRRTESQTPLMALLNQNLHSVRRLGEITQLGKCGSEGQ